MRLVSTLLVAVAGCLAVGATQPTALPPPPSFRVAYNVSVPPFSRGAGQVQSPLSVLTGNVVVVGTNPLVAIAADTGKTSWQVPMTGTVEALAAFPCWPGHVVASVLQPDLNKTLTALDTTSGKVLWNITTDAFMEGSACLSTGEALCVSINTFVQDTRYLVAFNARKGEAQLSFPLPDTANVLVSTSGDQVATCGGSQVCRMSVFSLRTADLIWSRGMASADDDYDQMNYAFDDQGNSYYSEAQMAFKLDKAGNMTAAAPILSGMHWGASFFIGTLGVYFVTPLTTLSGAVVHLSRYTTSLTLVWTSPNVTASNVVVDDASGVYMLGNCDDEDCTAPIVYKLDLTSGAIAWATTLSMPIGNVIDCDMAPTTTSVLAVCTFDVSTGLFEVDKASGAIIRQQIFHSRFTPTELVTPSGIIPMVDDTSVIGVTVG